MIAHDLDARMIAHDLDRKLLARTIEIARRTGKLGWRRLQAVLDAAPLAGGRHRGHVDPDRAGAERGCHGGPSSSASDRSTQSH